MDVNSDPKDYGTVKDVHKVDSDDDSEASSNGTDYDFEDILDKVGGMGLFQWRTWALLVTAEFCVAMSQIYFIFSNALPAWRCKLYSDGRTGTLMSRGVDKCHLNTSKCVEFEFSDDYRTIVTDWNLLCGYEYIPQLTITIQFLGLGFGCAIFGQLSDSFGRKIIGVIALAGLAASDMLVAASPNWIAFATFRFFVGGFAGGVLGIFCVYPLEFVSTKYRVMIGMMGIFTFGHLTLAFVAWMTREWRQTSLIIGLIKLPFLILIACFAPESPRWLIQKHRFTDAGVIIDKMAKTNGREFTDVELIPKVARSEDKMAQKALAYTYFDLFCDPKTAVMTASLCVLWFTVSEIYYGVEVMTNTFSGSLYQNAAISSLSAYPLQLLSIPIFMWVARKKAFYVYMTLTVLPMFLIGFLHLIINLPQESVYVTALAFTGKCFVNSLWCLVGLMTLENYPTLLRNIAIGAGNTFARFGGMLAPQLALLGTTSHWTWPYVIHGVFATISGVLVFLFIPETGKSRLPEMLPSKRNSTSKAEEKGKLVDNEAETAMKVD